MKIVVFGAAGNLGRFIVQEGLTRGHQLVAVVRNTTLANPFDARVTVLQGDATDEAQVAAAVKGADAVVNALSPRPSPEGRPASSLLQAGRALVAGLNTAGVKRLLIVGGAGSLEVAPGVRLVDSPHFPPEYKTEALVQGDALSFYRAEAGALEWTYLSPAAVIHPGPRTGKFRLGGDQLLADANGKSDITIEDYAVALVDELERPKHIRQRFTVAY